MRIILSTYDLLTPNSSANSFMFLNVYETTDSQIMAGLQKNVYPLYDEFKELRGLNGVKYHLSYVSSKQEAYTKRNVAKYLKKAIEQYLMLYWT